MKIISISDTHNRHKGLTIPECDLLIHCGDFTSMGYEKEIRTFSKWLNEQTQCKEIIIIPGNHELDFENQLPASKNWIYEECPRVKLLIDESVIIDGVKIHGTPVSPFFCNWAWNKLDKEEDGSIYFDYKVKSLKSIKPHFDNIPEDTNILITHTPPYGILDQTTYANGDLRPDHLGSQMLLNRIQELKELDLNFFGHIHAPGGTQYHRDGVSYYNSAICDEIYFPSNLITIVDYIKE